MIQQSYENVRGVCYTGYMLPQEQIKREFGYAKSININSQRFWTSYEKYLENPEEYLAKIKWYVEYAWSVGISSMPILFNGNMMDPAILEPEFYETGDRYVRDMVGMLKEYPGIIMWDIMNEPSCNDYLRGSEGEEHEARWAKMLVFLKHYCELVREIDPSAVITIGHTFISDVEDNIDFVDVFCFHDYLETRSRVEATSREAERIAEKYHKPYLNSELCCLGRANPYEMALKKCSEHHCGFYVFELMIRGYWADVHGIFYPDGTIRDPSVITAVLGFWRNKSETAIPENANKENYAVQGVQMVKDALTEDTTLFKGKSSSIEEVLEAAEFCANILEGCELVPMQDPPTAKIERIRKSGDLAAARKLAWKLARKLEKTCLL